MKLDFHLHRLFVTLILLASSLDLPAAGKNVIPVAGYVVELSGSVSARSRNGVVHLDVMTQIPAGTTVTVLKQAQLSVFLPAVAESVTLSGPGIYVIEEKVVRANGAAPGIERRALSTNFSGLRFKSEALAQTSLIMRGGATELELLEPVGMTTQMRDTRFVWHSASRAEVYEFTLADQDGATIHRTKTNGEELTLPPEIALHAGDSYVWSVRVDTGQPAANLRVARFNVVMPDEKARLEAVQPARGSPRGDWLIYAVWLDESGYSDWARRTFTRCCSEVTLAPEH
jgi:hypothetical protein